MKSRGFRADRPCPVTLLPALEAGTRFAVVLCGPATTVREFDSNFVSHKEPFVVLGDALLSGLPALEFDETITKSATLGAGVSDGFRVCLQTYFSSTLRMVPILPKQLSKSSFRVCSGRPPI